MVECVIYMHIMSKTTTHCKAIALTVCCGRQVATVLDYLDVSGNRLGGHLDELTLPASLVYADLSDNAIGGQLWSSTVGMGSLVELRLGKNMITGGCHGWATTF